MKRRDFLRNSVFIPARESHWPALCRVAAATISTTGNTTEETTGTDPAGTCTSTSISVDLHSHSVDQPDLTSSVDVTLDMSGGHTDTVTLPAADLANLSMCGTVINTSTTDSGHSHQVIFTGNS